MAKAGNFLFSSILEECEILATLAIFWTQGPQFFNSLSSWEENKQQKISRLLLFRKPEMAEAKSTATTKFRQAKLWKKEPETNAA